MDNLFYNVYGVAIHNVLPFLEKKCNIQNRNFTVVVPLYVINFN